MKRDDDVPLADATDEDIAKMDRIGRQNDDNYGAILQLTGIPGADSAEALHSKIKSLLADHDPCKKVQGKLLETLEWCLAVIAITTGKGHCGQFTPQPDTNDGRRSSCPSMMAAFVAGLSDSVVNVIATQPVRLQEVLIKGFQDALDKSYANHPGILKIPDMNQVRERIVKDRQIRGHGFTMTQSNAPGSKETH